MLRTMLSDTPFEQRWVLQGRLCGQWAVDLERQWEESRNARHGRQCVVDLEDVSYVDSVGEHVLLRMALDGSHLLATRAYMKHIVAGLIHYETVEQGEKGNGKRKNV
jgi:ABC-type transporter Mla MlaB component